MSSDEQGSAELEPERHRNVGLAKELVAAALRRDRVGLKAAVLGADEDALRDVAWFLAKVCAQLLRTEAAGDEETIAALAAVCQRSAADWQRGE